MKKRGFLVGEVTAWWVIAIVILVLSLVFYAIISGNGKEAIEQLQTILGFGP